MLCKIVYSYEGYGKESIYIQGSPAAIGLKVGDLLLSTGPYSTSMSGINIEVLPEPEQL